MRFVETHKFVDPSLVTDGYTDYVHGTYTNAIAPTFHTNFGRCVLLGELEAGPEPYARYNPTTGEFAAPLEPFDQPGVGDYRHAVWDDQNKTWYMP